MNLFYCVLCLVMVVFNGLKAYNLSSVMNLALAVMWLSIGIVFAVRHVKEVQHAKKKKQMREEREQNG